MLMCQWRYKLGLPSTEARLEWMEDLSHLWVLTGSWDPRSDCHLATCEHRGQALILGCDWSDKRYPAPYWLMIQWVSGVDDLTEWSGTSSTDVLNISPGSCSTLTSPLFCSASCILVYLDNNVLTSPPRDHALIRDTDHAGTHDSCVWSQSSASWQCVTCDQIL